VNLPPREQRPVGRPPGPHDDTLAKIIPSALELLLAEGSAALTPTRLNKATGVARATIYRNWPQPASLIEIMLERAMAETELPAPSDNPRADLEMAMELVIDRLGRPSVRALISACMEHGHRSASMATARTGFLHSVLEPLNSALARTEIGEATTAGVDPVDAQWALLTELAGPIVLEVLVMGRTVAPGSARAVVEQFLQHHETRRR